MRSTELASAEVTPGRALELATVVARPPDLRSDRRSQHGAGNEGEAARGRQAGRAARPRRPEPQEAALRVLVAARHQATRAGLRALVAEAGFDLCGECGDVEEAVTRAAADSPDVCVLDSDLAPGGGRAAAAVIALLPSRPRIIVLAASDDSAEFFAALRAGADGYLVGGLEAGRLAEAVRAVAAGEAFVEPALVTYLVHEARTQRWRAAGELTPREAQVLALLQERLTTKQVAARLGISPTTVRRHVSSALRKLGAGDRAAALARLTDVHRRAERK